MIVSRIELYVKTHGGVSMALEVLKTSAYQNGSGSAAQSLDAGELKSADVNFSTSIHDKTENDEKELKASEQHIKSEISKANQKLKSHNVRCEFGYHEETKRVTIKIMDKDTEEIIREVPPEKTLAMIEKMWELAGLLVDEKI